MSGEYEEIAETPDGTHLYRDPNTGEYYLEYSINSPGSKDANGNIVVESLTIVNKITFEEAQALQSNLQDLHDSDVPRESSSKNEKVFVEGSGHK